MEDMADDELTELRRESEELRRGIEESRRRLERIEEMRLSHEKSLLEAAGALDRCDALVEEARRRLDALQTAG